MGEDDQPRFDVPIDPDLDAPEVAEHPPSRHADLRTQLDVLAAVAAGGALGAPARYEISQLIHVAKNTFPWATFWTNVTGSLALGMLLVLIIERFPPSRYLRAFIAIGFLGAYTTMSTYMVDADLLIKNHHPAVAAVYVIASMIAGFAAAWAGIIAGRTLGFAGRGAPARR